MAYGVLFSEVLKVGDSSVTSVADVPDECLASAFRLLQSKDDKDAVALTCRRWRAIVAFSRHSLQFVHDPSDRPSYEADFLHGRLLHASRTFPRIFSIRIVRFTQYLPDSIFRLFESRVFSHLDALHLEFCFDVTDKRIDYVSAGCPALTKLTVTRCSPVDDTSMHAVARGLPSLEYLDVSHCWRVTDAGIDDVLKNCPNMQDISFSHCPFVDGWGLKNRKSLMKVQAECCELTDAGLVEGFQGATSIQIINMANMRSYVRLMERGLRQLGLSCKMLQVLCLRKCRVVDDGTVHIIAQNCVSLSVWDLSLCQKITLVGWRALALHCAVLQFLDVHLCSLFCDASMLAIQESCPGLCCVHVTGCSLLTPRSFTHFRNSRPNVRVDREGALTNCCHIT